MWFGDWESKVPSDMAGTGRVGVCTGYYFAYVCPCLWSVGIYALECCYPRGPKGVKLELQAIKLPAVSAEN